MNDLADARMRNLYCGLIGALVVAGAIVVGCANSADASERHHPQPRPHIEKNYTTNKSMNTNAYGGKSNSTSSSGGNSQAIQGDDYDSFAFGYAAPGMSYSPGVDIFDGVAMESEMLQFPIVGGGYAHTTAHVTTPYMVGPGSDWLAWALTWDQSSGNEFKNAQARAIVAAFCDKEPGIMDQMNVECR